MAVSTEGGSSPRWPARAGQIFYRNGNALFAVPVRTQPDLVVGRPSKLFDAHFAVTRDGSAFDVFPDGMRFVVVEDAAQDVRLRLAYVPDWFDELKAKLRTAPR